MAEALGMSLCHYVIMSLCLSFVIIRAGCLGDYSPLWGRGEGGARGGARRRGQLVGQALLPFLSFLYRVPTIILWIFFLFSFFLFNFVPIIKEIRTINRKILRTKHLLNWPAQFCCLTNDCYCTTSICFLHFRPYVEEPW